MLSIADLTLTPTELTLIRKHCELAGSIHRMRRLRSFMKDEIHNKRAVFKRKKYKINPELQGPYDKIIFGGKRSFNGFDVFPCEYMGILDSLMFDEFRKTNIEQALGPGFPSITGVYYDSKFPIFELQSAREFDQTEWGLNNPADDLKTLERFRDEFIGLMLHVETVLADTAPEFRKRHRVHRLAKERQRYAKVVGVAD